ncbi:MAG TPA: protein kinase [Gemmatimonadaceae bacterium]|jgi:serine/threonine-protein kinase
MIGTDSTDRISARDLSPTRGIAGRVFLNTAAIICAVLIATLIVASYSARRATREAERRSLEQAADLTAQLLSGRGRSLAGGARVFVQSPQFRSLVAERQHDDILDQAFEAAGQLGADWVFITDEQGNLLAKSDEPGVRGVSMSGIPLVEGALEGRTTFGFGISRDTLLFQIVAVPIVVPQAAPVGVLVATKLVDRQMALDVRAATGADIVFYALDTHGKPHVAATSLDSSRYAVAALPEALPNERGTAAASDDSTSPGPRAARTAIIGRAPYALQGAALTTAGGEVIGGFIVGHPESATSAQLAGIRRSLVIAGLLGLVLALAAAWSSARRVTHPTRALATAAAYALEGEYDEAARLAAETSAGASSAEIAALGAALTAFLQELREKRALGALLERTAPGEAVPNDATTDLIDERVGRVRTSAGRTRTPLATQLSARLGTLTLPSGALAPGFVVAERYEIQDVVGVGGTGIVYRAKDRTLDEVLALKMLRPELLVDDPRAREELKRELRLTRRVSHRNIVRTHDFGVSRGVPYLTMEFVQGTSLAAVLARRGTLPTPIVLALAKQLMRALDAAHEQGVMHGDVKPANLLLANDGLLKVTDFGVASLIRRPASAAVAKASADDVGPPRLAGAVVGTPEYMAPELLLGGQPDVRTDVYSAGMVLHECLTGATPFQGDTPRGFLAQKLDTPRETLIPIRGPGKEPRTLAAVVARMTAPEADDRPASAAAVSALLARLG